MQSGYDGHTIMIRVAQHQHGGSCHVPIFGFPYYAVRVTSGGLSQPSHRGETMSSMSSKGLDEFYGAHLSLFTIIHHRDCYPPV
jgi:hypothetical protein